MLKILWLFDNFCSAIKAYHNSLSVKWIQAVLCEKLNWTATFQTYRRWVFENKKIRFAWSSPFKMWEHIKLSIINKFTAHFAHSHTKSLQMIWRARKYSEEEIKVVDYSKAWLFIIIYRVDIRLHVPHIRPLQLLPCVKETVHCGFPAECGTSCMEWVRLRWEKQGRGWHLFCHLAECVHV